MPKHLEVVGQTLPQEPQFFVSKARSTHVGTPLTLQTPGNVPGQTQAVPKAVEQLAPTGQQPHGAMKF